MKKGMKVIRTEYLNKKIFIYICDVKNNEET